MKKLLLLILISFISNTYAGIGQDQMKPSTGTGFDFFNSPKDKSLGEVDPSIGKRTNLKEYPKIDESKIEYVKYTASGKNKKGFGTYYNIEDNNFRGVPNSKVLSGFLQEGTYKIGKNSYFIPINSLNVKKIQWIYGWGWLSLDCDTNEIKDFGAYQGNGNFGKNPPYKTMGNTTFDTLPMVFCGTEFESKTYYQSGGVWDPKTVDHGYYHFVWTAADNFIDGDKRNIITLNGQRAPKDSSKISGYALKSSATVDCSKKTVSINNGVDGVFDVMDDKNYHYQLLYKQICVVNSVFYKANTFITQKKKESPISEPIKKKNPVTLGKEEAKKTCLELGFKAGTDKYLDCVLELL